jgi:multisubunit Na+/H+ antiporter MnhG subunit
MNKQRIALLASRIIIMLSSLGIVWMNTYFLGLEGQGEAGLISFGILIVATVSMFITGGNIVYFTPRMQQGETIRVAWIWNTLSAV